MSKELKIKGSLSNDYQQVYIDDKPTNLFVNEDGKFKTNNIVPDVDTGDLNIKASKNIDISPANVVNIKPSGALVN